MKVPAAIIIGAAVLMLGTGSMAGDLSEAEKESLILIETCIDDLLEVLRDPNFLRIHPGSVRVRVLEGDKVKAIGSLPAFDAGVTFKYTSNRAYGKEDMSDRICTFRDGKLIYSKSKIPFANRKIVE